MLRFQGIIYLSKPRLAISRYDDQDREHRMSAAEMKATPAPVRRGDRVAVLYGPGGAAIYSEPVRGKTLYALVSALERGLKRRRRYATDDQDTHAAVMAHIGQWLRAAGARELAARYTGAGLTARDLLGDYAFAECFFRRERGGLWVYALGS